MRRFGGRLQSWVAGAALVFLCALIHFAFAAPAPGAAGASNISGSAAALVASESVASPDALRSATTSSTSGSEASPVPSGSATSSVSGAAKTPAKDGLPPERSQDERSQDVAPKNFYIVIGIVLLMGILFFVVFLWSAWMERSSYFANVFRDAVRKHESYRLIEPIRSKWERGEFHDEMIMEQSNRGVAWIETHPRPKATEQLLNLAKTLGGLYLYKVSDLEYMTYTRSRFRQKTPMPGLPDLEEAGLQWSRTGGLGDSRRSGRSGSGIGVTTDKLTSEQTEKEKELEKIYREFDKELELLRTRIRHWMDELNSTASKWYQEELTEAQNEVTRQGDRALSVDLSALRGRGPEFILEFTAVVVIIFAAVILGILEKLGTEQIGTLLAAIAGYVLGKGTRSRSEETVERTSTKPGIKPAMPTIEVPIEVTMPQHGVVANEVTKH